MKTTKKRKVRIKPIPGYMVLHKCGHWQEHPHCTKKDATRRKNWECENCVPDHCLMH